MHQENHYVFDNPFAFYFFKGSKESARPKKGRHSLTEMPAFGAEWERCIHKGATLPVVYLFFGGSPLQKSFYSWTRTVALSY